LPLVVGIQLACLVGRRQCRGLLCYFGMPELVQLTRGLLQAALILLTLSLLVPHLLPARNLLLMDLCISTSLLNGLRIALLRWRERSEGEPAPTDTPPVRVGIIGAGSLGAELGRCFNTQKSLGRTTVVFFDDDFGKWQKSIHQIPVAGMPECLLQGWSERLDEVAIALPDACPARLAQIHQLVEKTRLKVYSVPWPAPTSPGMPLQAA
jgi:FlaA1/EpsC-like NDP-sugar epimerase